MTLADGFSVSGPARDVIVAVLAWAAQMERQAISERIMAARERIEGEGGTWGRPRREVDLAQIALLKAAHKSVREISETLRVPRSIIGRAVRELNCLQTVPKTPSISEPLKGTKKAKKRD